MNDRSLEGWAKIILGDRYGKKRKESRMDELTVRIVKAGEFSYWYARLEGMTFKVYDNGRDYILKEDYDAGYECPWRHMNKEDVEVIE